MNGTKPKPKDALVVFSGGQDSTTCLFWAKAHYSRVHAITFDYNQRHARELQAAATVAAMANVVSHEFCALGPVLKGTSPLVSDAPVGHYESAAKLPGGIEPTFVPARNLLFLTIAANRAAVLGCEAIVTGVCEEDYGGYPDCRHNFIVSMEQTIQEALYGTEGYDEPKIKIETPLMRLTKRETVVLAASMPECWKALAYTHTCYDGEYPPNPRNHASLLRAKGFHDALLPDPLIVRAKAEKLLPGDYPDTGLVEGTRYGTQHDARL